MNKREILESILERLTDEPFTDKETVKVRDEIETLLMESGLKPERMCIYDVETLKGKVVYVRTVDNYLGINEPAYELYTNGMPQFMHMTAAEWERQAALGRIRFVGEVRL